MSCQVVGWAVAETSSARLQPPTVGRHCRGDGGCLSMRQHPRALSLSSVLKGPKAQLGGPHTAQNHTRSAKINC